MTSTIYLTETGNEGAWTKYTLTVVLHVEAASSDGLGTNSAGVERYAITQAIKDLTARLEELLL